LSLKVPLGLKLKHIAPPTIQNLSTEIRSYVNQNYQNEHTDCLLPLTHNSVPYVVHTDN